MCTHRTTVHDLSTLTLVLKKKYMVFNAEKSSLFVNTVETLSAGTLAIGGSKYYFPPPRQSPV